ncbi:hypothetical protein [Paenibacillus campinasensis]|uniref:Uncharacterized protein n=1 Tax=Paenibacillus campinasensis TaxID=66347 RepID=A0A268EIB3_9BACL|nr:hypothetical protein [Paenibacillus campinasensis]PAD72849.1 hypothetical protein CHH67_21315 [Paenibacillus campinasensis]
MKTPKYIIKSNARSCLWYAAARDQVLEAHPDQDLIDLGKIALVVPTELVTMLGDKKLEKVYAPVHDLIQVNE